METVLLKTFDNYFSANIILNRLQHAGVPCFLKDEYTVTIDPILSNAIGGIKLMSPADSAEVAQKLLQEYEDDYIKSAVCPDCGRHEIERIAKAGPTNFLTAVFTWFFSNYAVAMEYVYQCQHCKFESENLPLNPAEYN